MVNNVYIHIPFCRQKCRYCSFVSFPDISKKNEYITALITEITAKYKKEPLSTLYFGGGTPSLLSTDDFRQIISAFNISKDTEITTELNPEENTKEYLMGLYSLGINRLSIGCQTFDDKILKIIGRCHTSEKVKEIVNLAQNVGFENLSLDFIYGLPTQTIEGFAKDLETAAGLGVKHISLYGLKIEEGCYFYNKMPEHLPDADTQADMYIKAAEVMTNFGYEHYEVSNFSQKGFESRHNLNYWDNNFYYGFGVAAHGYIDNIRYANKKTIDEYIKNPLVPEDDKKLTITEQLEEEIFLGFRKKEGINVNLINNKYNIDFDKKYSEILNKYLGSKHIIRTNNGYKLSLDGVLVSNYILADFLDT